MGCGEEDVVIGDNQGWRTHTGENKKGDKLEGRRTKNLYKVLRDFGKKGKTKHEVKEEAYFEVWKAVAESAKVVQKTSTLFWPSFCPQVQRSTPFELKKALRVGSKNDKFNAKGET